MGSLHYGNNNKNDLLLVDGSTTSGLEERTYGYSTQHTLNKLGLHINPY
jgi:uncharacterized membrane protein